MLTIRKPAQIPQQCCKIPNSLRGGWVLINAPYSIDYICDNIPMQQRGWNSSCSSQWDLNYSKWEWGHYLLLIKTGSWKDKLLIICVQSLMPYSHRAQGSPAHRRRSKNVCESGSKCSITLKGSPWRMGAHPGCLTLNIYVKTHQQSNELPQISSFKARQVC